MMLNTDSLNLKIELLRQLKSELNFYKKQNKEALKKIKSYSFKICNLTNRISKEENLINLDLIQDNLERKK
tara:strand:- start:776 stop:988 length:213 start_codon:yes stop_codon:yes gene_type:complete